MSTAGSDVGANELARPTDHAASSVADHPVEAAQFIGEWDIVADQGGCSRPVRLRNDYTIDFGDGIGAGTWAIHGDGVQIDATHTSIPLAETGLAAQERVSVRWRGELRRNAEGVFAGELTIDVLSSGGGVRSSRRASFTAAKS